MSKDILYPLRRLHGQFAEQKLEKQAAKAFAKQLSSSKGNGIYILGTPLHQNIGDSAIVLAEQAFLQRCNIAKEGLCEITTYEMRRFPKTVLRQITKEALICWHGGGNLGNQWMGEELLRRDFLTKTKNISTLIMPQTIYYTPDEKGLQEQRASVAIYNEHKHLTIVAREKTSFVLLEELYPNTNVLLTPDIVLSATMETFDAKPQKRNGILLCMRSDAERAMTDNTRQAIEQLVRETGKDFRYTDMYATKAVTKENRAGCVKEKLEELASAKLVITDRLHGMVFAAITGTPCIAFGNYNHKVSGTYHWIKYLPYIKYAETTDEAKKWIPELLKMGGQVYDNTPLMPYFEELAQVVKKHANN